LGSDKGRDKLDADLDDYWAARKEGGGDAAAAEGEAEEIAE
jgi:hypothetical protein